MKSNVPSEKEMLELNLKDPDEIVEFVLRYYNKNGIKTEADLIKNLTEGHPLMTAIKLQNEKGR